MSDRACTFYIVRHGQAKLNRDRIVMGQLDSPLTPAGQAQAARIRSDLTNYSFGAFLSSDLRRAIDTVRTIAGANANILLDSRLRERSFGRLEGQPYKSLVILREECEKLAPEKLWHYKLAADVESDAEVHDRAYECLSQKAIEYEGQNVLVVTHSGPIRVLLMGIGISLPPGSFQHGQYAKLQFEDDSVIFQGIFPAIEESSEQTTE